MNQNIVVYIFYHLDQPKVTVKLDIGIHMYDCMDLHKFVSHLSIHILKHISDLYIPHTNHQFKDMSKHIIFQYRNQMKVDQKGID